MTSFTCMFINNFLSENKEPGTPDDNNFGNLIFKINYAFN